MTALHWFRNYIRHPLVQAIIFFTVVHAINVGQYEIFAEKDSYGWALQYEKAFSQGSLELYRPFFAAFIYGLQTLTGLNVGQIFKYLLPFFSTLVLFPIWILARDLRGRSWQLLFLCCVFVSPAVIFQMESLRPQIMVIYYLYFLLGATYYFRSRMDIRFDLGVGMSLLLGIFFHSFFGILFLFWLFSLYTVRWKWFWYHKQKSLLGVLFLTFLTPLLFHSAQIGGYLNFIPELIKNIADQVRGLNTNFLYPASYINSDGVPLGWPGWMGVIKFYAFYTGPLLFTTIGVVVTLCFIAPSGRKYFLTRFKEPKYFFVYFSILTLFVICEVFPRLFNIALLPDRLWTFLSILLLLPLHHLFLYLQENITIQWQKKLFFWVFFTAFGIGILGAYYVNNQFQYLSSPQEKEAFVWIQKNLPSNRVLFNFGYGAMLAYHSGSEVHMLDAYLLDESLGEKGRKNILQCQLNDETRESFYKINDSLKTVSGQISSIQTRYSYAASSYGIELRGITDTLLEDYKSVEEILKKINSFCDRPFYIYVAYTQEKNPFKGRPYDTGYSFSIEKQAVSFFNGHTGEFDKIFDNGQVFIWHVKGSGKK